MRRWLSAGAVLVLLSVGLVGSAGARGPGPIGLPAVQATLKDQCTGMNVPGFVASITDAGGASVAPSKITSSGFTINSFDGPIGLLAVSAPDYLPLGDPASPNPGVLVAKNPGPGQDQASAQANPGPTQLPNGIQVATGIVLKILLMPAGGCAAGTTPRRASITALSAKVIDADTGAAVPGLTVNIVPDPSSSTANQPGPIQVSDGAFTEKSLACGDYDLDVSAGPSWESLTDGSMGISQEGIDVNCDGQLGAGDVGFGTKMIIAMPKAGTNHVPVIDWVVSSSYFALLTPDGAVPVVDLSAAAHDPDPADNPTLTYKWDAYVMPQLGVIDDCALATPTSLTTTMSCDDSPSRTAWVSFTVTDQHGAKATKHLTVKIN